MNYDIKCTFFINKNDVQKIISQSIINDLKILNKEKYVISFSDVNPTTDNIKINDIVCRHYMTDYSFSNNIEIYKTKYEKEQGFLYDQNSFIQGALYFYNKVEEERKQIINLENIINGVEYYKLDLNQRENMMEDLQCANESMEIFETAYLTCRKMINLFEYFGREEIIDNNWNNRNGKIYCYISRI